MFLEESVFSTMSVAFSDVESLPQFEVNRLEQRQCRELVLPQNEVNRLENFKAMTYHSTKLIAWRLFTALKDKATFSEVDTGKL